MICFRRSSHPFRRTDLWLPKLLQPYWGAILTYTLQGKCLRWCATLSVSGPTVVAGPLDSGQIFLNRLTNQNSLNCLWFWLVVGNVCTIGTQIDLCTKLAFSVSRMILFGWIFQLFPEYLACLNLQGVSDKIFHKRRFAWSTACHWSNIDRIKSTKSCIFKVSWRTYLVPLTVQYPQGRVNQLSWVHSFQTCLYLAVGFLYAFNPEKQIWGSSCKPVKFLQALLAMMHVMWAQVSLKGMTWGWFWHLESAKPNPWWHCRL